jgi:uncharacterized membrane protein
MILLTYWLINEAKIITYNNKLLRLYKPVKIGLVISLLAGLFYLSYYWKIVNTFYYRRNAELDLFFLNFIEVLFPIIVLCVIIYVAYKIIQINTIKPIKAKILIYSISLLIGIIGLFSPSILVAILLVLLSFLVNYKTGFVIGIISMIYSFSQYYYDLSFTLLTKSILLFISGILFLFLYLWTTKMLKTNEKV